MTSTYKTLDNFPDLPSELLSSAVPLSFSKANPNSNGWEFETNFMSENYYPAGKIFSMQGKEGATYDFAVSSYFNPSFVAVFDSAGNTIAEAHNAISLSNSNNQVIYLTKYVAPYTGTYYVFTNWNQGFSSSNKLEVLVIGEDTDVQSAPTGVVMIGGVYQQNETLTVSNTLNDGNGMLGAVSYQWLKDGIQVQGNQTTYGLTQADVEKNISVTASYTDGLGKLENVTSNTVNIANVNDLPTGSVTITGEALQGKTLTVTNSLADLDGLGQISYQWLNNGTAISGANQTTFTLTSAYDGKSISVKASYTDLQGTVESVISNVVNIVNVNDSPTGTVTISGETQQGKILTVSNTLADIDGLGSISYQWLSSGTPMSGANQATYTLTASDVGKAISVKASYTDLQGTAESVTSNSTALVLGLQSAPTGSVTISGTASQNQTLTAQNTLADANGLGTVSYQWLSEGMAITGANQATYALTQTDVGKNISISTSYTDGLGKLESVTSNVVKIANVNDLPTGSVTISGTATQGQILTASNSLADLDGLGVINYQWLNAAGTPIFGANQATYTLTATDVGKVISVKASYVDLQGTAESVTSNPTALISAPVIPVNHPPVGDVSVNGIPEKNQILWARNKITDVDNLGVISYQWFSNDLPIKNANQAVYQVTELDVGHNISVSATYTDGLGKLESVLSNSVTVAEIPVVNNPPTGSVTIKGDAKVGSVLSLINTIKDADGLGEFSYSWETDDVILSFDNAPLKITSDEIGKEIWATISYTDGAGNYEEIKSEPTLAVTVAKISTVSSTENDLLTGTTKADKLSGLAGNDTLIGGLGKDALTGGKGADVFKYTSLKDSGITATTRETITDFKHSEKDKIDLSSIDTNEKLAGDQAFTVIGSSAFSKTDATGQLRFDSKTGILYGSTDKDSAAEFSLQLSGVKNLVADDFVL